MIDFETHKFVWNMCTTDVLCNTHLCEMSIGQIQNEYCSDPIDHNSATWCAA